LPKLKSHDFSYKLRLGRLNPLEHHQLFAKRVAKLNVWDLRFLNQQHGNAKSAIRFPTVKFTISARFAEDGKVVMTPQLPILRQLCFLESFIALAGFCQGTGKDVPKNTHVGLRAILPAILDAADVRLEIARDGRE
jgi:hypothetical protein